MTGQVDSTYVSSLPDPCSIFGWSYTLTMGRATAQAVSHWLPTAAARVRSRIWKSGICGEQSGAGADFLLVFRFPLRIFIPPNSPSS
jgi:hypothetical protein